MHSSPQTTVSGWNRTQDLAPRCLVGSWMRRPSSSSSVVRGGPHMPHGPEAGSTKHRPSTSTAICHLPYLFAIYLFKAVPAITTTGATSQPPAPDKRRSRHPFRSCSKQPPPPKLPHAPRAGWRLEAAFHAHVPVPATHGISAPVNWSLWEGIAIQRSGRPISHNKLSGITHQTPKRKEEVENKTIFRPF
jgi:hypothetical protein